MTPVVRRAGPADVEAVAAAQTRAWYEAYQGLVADSYLLDPEIEGRRVSRWRARIAGERQVLIADDAGQIVGVVSSGPSRDDPPAAPLELMSLYLLEAYQGTGLGNRLLRAALAEQAASLWVFDANARAQAFYRRHRFGPDGASTIDPDTGLVEIRMVRGIGTAAPMLS